MTGAERPNPYTVGLDRNAANFVALTPLDFIARTASIFPERIAVVHGERRYRGPRPIAVAGSLRAPCAAAASARTTPLP